MSHTPDDFVFFWKPEQPHGWASQWHHSPFSAPITLPGGAHLDVVFPTAEHWMMAQKALLFGDTDIFRRIVGLPSSSSSDSNSASAPPPSAASTISSGLRPTRSTRARSRESKFKSHSHSQAQPQANAKAGVRAPGPKEVKALGRKVKDFDEATWVRARSGVVLAGSLLKFRQHAALRAELLRTGDRELVEASPLDWVWGIGLAADKAARTCASAESRAGAGWGLNLLGEALMEAREVLREEAGGEGVLGQDDACA